MRRHLQIKSLATARSGALGFSSLLLVVLALVFAGTGWLVAATNKQSSNYVISTWQEEQGLPQRAITSIVQTRDGYLWLGTYNGLVRFDGVRFTLFDESSTPPLANERVTSLCEDATGTLWLGHESGELTSLAGGQFASRDISGIWPGESIINVLDDQNGGLLLIGDRKQILRLTNSTDNPLPPSLTEKPPGYICVVVLNHLARCEPGGLIALPNSSSPPGKTFRLSCASRRGGWWVAGDSFLGRWLDGKWVDEVTPCPWGRAATTTLIETRSGDLAVGTLRDGLFLRRLGGEIEHVTMAQGLTADWIRSLCEDREGNLWVGTGGGLSALRPQSAESFNISPSVGEITALSVCPARDGGLWVGTEGHGLLRFKDGEFSRPDFATNLPDPYVWSVLETKSVDLWVGTWGGGLRVWREGAWKNPLAPQGVNEPVLSLMEGRHGEMLVGTKAGLLRCTPESSAWLTPTNESAKFDVRCIAEDAAGRIWFGLSGAGLGCWESGKIKLFAINEGLPSESVWTLLPEADGTLWIGTRTGLARIKDGRISSIGKPQGLSADFIAHIADDGQGFLWLGTDEGIFRASKLDLIACVERRLSRVRFLGYSHAEGMSSITCSGGFQPSGCRTPDGRFWFPTRRGIVAVNPSAVRTNQLAPPVVIEELRVDGIPWHLAPAAASKSSGHANVGWLLSHWPPEISIAPGWHDLEFRFTGLSFAAPKKVRFRWKLEGWDTDWVEGGSARAVSYRFLPPGRYHFHVTACNNDGVWNPLGALLSFRVRPPFWKTWWFRVAAFATILTTIMSTAMALQKRRYRLALADAERWRAVERERLRIAKDIHDEVGSSLTRVGMMAEMASGSLDADDPSQPRFERIAATTRQIVQAMDEIVWAVNPRNDTVVGFANYLVHFAEDLMRHSGVQLSLDVPVYLPAQPLPTELRHNLFLAAKEALHNALKHSRASRVSLGVAFDQKRITVIIEDDGQGFDPAAPSATGNGLGNMRERIESLAGTFKLNSAPGRGTTVSLEINLPG